LSMTDSRKGSALPGYRIFPLLIIEWE
jgi:hypothetical protein